MHKSEISSTTYSLTSELEDWKLPKEIRSLFQMSWTGYWWWQCRRHFRLKSIRFLWWTQFVLNVVLFKGMQFLKKLNPPKLTVWLYPNLPQFSQTWRGSQSPALAWLTPKHIWVSTQDIYIYRQRTEESWGWFGWHGTVPQSNICSVCIHNINE